MQYIFHPSSKRGLTQISWLKSYHSFSFGNYYNPNQMHFGALRVLNDDTISPSTGFDLHSHANMEIVSIPLKGSLLHKDSLGKETIISKGEVQIMSAGSGISHSEYNNSATETTEFLQIWLFPKSLNSDPYYQQIAYDDKIESNRLVQILSPKESDTTVLIQQDASMYIGYFDEKQTFNYTPSSSSNGVYMFVISGVFQWNDTILSSRDGLGVWEVDALTLTALEASSEILIIDVPMEF